MSTSREAAAASRISHGHLSNVALRRRWMIIGLLFTASLLNYFDRATISFALPFISKEMHLDATTKGLLLSSFFWSYALMQIPIGWCVDRCNLYWLYAGAFALWSLAQGLTGLAGTLGTLIGFRVLLGIGESIYLPGGSKIVSLLFARNDRGLPGGFFDFGTRTGLVLEGVLVPWLLVHYGWRRAFLLIGTTALVWLVPWFLIYPRHLRSVQAASLPSQPTRSTLSFRELANRDLLGMCLGFFCFDYYWYVLVTWLPDYLVNVRHLSTLQAGLCTAVAFLTFGGAQPLGGWFADRLIGRGHQETKTRKGMVTIAFLAGILLVPAMLVSDTRLAIAFLIGACLVGLATGNLLVILQCCAPPERIGIWTGAENFAGNLAGVAAPLAVGWLIRLTNSYAPGFVLGSLVLMLGVPAYWFLVGDLKSQNPT
jgi:MFS family permease